VRREETQTQLPQGLPLVLSPGPAGAFHFPKMRRMIHISAICLVGAIFFKAVDWLNLDRWVAIILKCAIIAGGVVGIGTQLLP